MSAPPTHEEAKLVGGVGRSATVLGYFFYGTLALGIPMTAAIAYTSGAYWPMGVLAAFVGGFFVGAVFATNLIAFQAQLTQKRTTKETSNHGQET